MTANTIHNTPKKSKQSRGHDQKSYLRCISPPLLLFWAGSLAANQVNIPSDGDRWMYNREWVLINDEPSIFRQGTPMTRRSPSIRKRLMGGIKRVPPNVWMPGSQVIHKHLWDCLKERNTYSWKLEWSWLERQHHDSMSRLAWLLPSQIPRLRD